MFTKLEINLILELSCIPTRAKGVQKAITKEYKGKFAVHQLPQPPPPPSVSPQPTLIEAVVSSANSQAADSLTLLFATNSHKDRLLYPAIGIPLPVFGFFRERG